MATGRYPLALVIPDGEKAASRGDREVGLPLGLGLIDVSVEHERSAESHPAVGRADIEDVTGVAVAGVAGTVDVMNHAIEGGRLTPALVTPVSGAVVHGGEGTRSATTGCVKGGTNIGVSPCIAAVSGPVETVGTGGEAAGPLVHGSDVNGACA